MSNEVPLLENVDFGDIQFHPHAHDWVQKGTELSCDTCPKLHAHGTRIPAGLMLIGTRGHWKLVPEGGVPREAAKAYGL